ncbi:transcription factor 23-like [Engystomops pustulosus]|uniref:transcription factor 23-like n=1 Tax=Engystomops pustulosus TaxID=76066 RepID=UPI003AFAFD34
MDRTGAMAQVLRQGASMEGGDKEEVLQKGWQLEPRIRQGVTTKTPVLKVAKTKKPFPGKQSPENNARERNRVRTLRQAFLSLQAALPSVPPDTKLSKLDVLVLATSYIAHLTHTLHQEGHPATAPHTGRGPGYLHPMKKWPMRSRLYAEALQHEDRSAVSED